MTKPTSTQIGAIAENLVANALMLESRGRLSPFLAMADDDGIDLLIYDKLTGRALPVQVKSRTLTLKKRGSQERGNLVHFELRTATYRMDRFAAVILVLLGQEAYSIERSWVIPMREFQGLARASATKLVVRPNRGEASEDRFRHFRCSAPKQLYERILEEIMRLPVSAQLESEDAAVSGVDA
jgi:hypothetical protein